MILSGLFVDAAILVIEIEEVLLARIAEGCTILSISEKSLNFRAGSSDTASTTRSTFVKAEISVVVVILFKVALRTSSVILFLATSFCNSLSARVRRRGSLVGGTHERHGPCNLVLAFVYQHHFQSCHLSCHLSDTSAHLPCP